MRTHFFAVLLAAVAVTSVGADTQVDISGQVRVRTELDDRSFDTANSYQDFASLRTRVDVKAAVAGNAQAFVQFQDSRTLGGTDQFGAWQSGTLNDGKSVDLHQAYLEVAKVWLAGLGMKAGRFEFAMGNERVFGPVGWSNVGRSWEGGLAWYQGHGFRVSGFLFRVQEENYASFTGDFALIGLHTGIERAGLELFGVYERDNDTIGMFLGDTIRVADPQDHIMDRWSFGYYYSKKYNQFDFESNGVYQAGQVVSDSTTIDLQAFMFTGEVGYNFEGAGKARMAAGVDYASGDDDPADTDYQAYDNLYYTGHKFRGHMDYFVGSEPAGLMDIMVRGRVDFHPDWTVAADFHYFMTAQDYPDPADSSATKDVGIELDATVSTVSVAGIKLAGGISLFLPQASFVRLKLDDPDMTENDPTVWSFVQAIVDF